MYDLNEYPPTIVEFDGKINLNNINYKQLFDVMGQVHNVRLNDSYDNGWYRFEHRSYNVETYGPSNGGSIEKYKEWCNIRYFKFHKWDEEEQKLFYSYTKSCYFFYFFTHFNRFF